MKKLKNILQGIVLCIFLTLISADTAFSQETAKKDSVQCYTKEQIDLSQIATFRDSWVPKNYVPLPEWLIYVDLSVLLLLLLTGVFFVVKRKPSGWMTWLAVITLVYLAIIRGGCICPMGLTTNMLMGIFSPYNISLVGLVMFIAPLAIALVAGRVFCTAGCPLGAVQHLIYKKKKGYKIPAKFDRYIKIVPILVLGITVFFAIKGTLFIGCEIDPYKPLFFTGKVWFEQGVAYLNGTPMENRFLLSFGIFAWIYFLITVALGYWVQRPFCRLLCPYSALLGLFSLVSFKQRTINKQTCTYCNLCVKSCPTQAITINKKEGIQTVSNYDCIQCNRCTSSCKINAI